jgi:hypothetical protein
VGNSSSLARLALASKERLPNCNHCHRALMKSHRLQRHCQQQIAESGDRHENLNHQKEYKLMAHWDSEILSLALENTSVDHAVTHIELVTPQNFCQGQHSMRSLFVVTSTRNCPCRVCRLSQNNLMRQNLSILSNDLLILMTSTNSLMWSSFFSSSFAKC